MNKQEAQQYIAQYLNSTKPLWSVNALPASAGKKMMQDASAHIKSNGQLDEFGGYVVKAIKNKGQTVPQQFFDALAVIAGKMDMAVVGRQNSIMKWVMQMRSFIQSNAKQTAQANGQPRSAEKFIREANPRWQAIEVYRTKKDPTLLISTYQQNLFPEASQIMSDLLFLYPQYSQGVPSSSSSSIQPSSQSDSPSYSPSYSPSSNGQGMDWSRLALLLLLGGGGLYLAKQKKLF